MDKEYKEGKESLLETDTWKLFAAILYLQINIKYLDGILEKRKSPFSARFAPVV